MKLIFVKYLPSFSFPTDCKMRFVKLSFDGHILSVVTGSDYFYSFILINIYPLLVHGRHDTLCQSMYGAGDTHSLITRAWGNTRGSTLVKIFTKTRNIRWLIIRFLISGKALPHKIRNKFQKYVSHPNFGCYYRENSFFQIVCIIDKGCVAYTVSIFD